MDSGSDDDIARALVEATARLRETVRQAASSGLSTHEISELTGLTSDDVLALMTDD